MKTILKMIVLLILVVVVWGNDALASKKVEVMLKGQAQAITGYLREVSQATYILQGGDQFYEFGAEDLISVNGKKEPSKNDLGQGRLIYTTRYEKILANGDVEIWQNMDVDNGSSTMIESVSWGAAEWELEEVRQQEVLDQFGNSLPTSLTAQESGGYRVEVRLRVPVAPRESISLNIKRLNKGGCSPTESGGWSYTFNCDFPEDRFFVRKVELPAGARVAAPSGWWRHELAGRVFLFSQFYYPAHTAVPQVIEYQLP